MEWLARRTTELILFILGAFALGLGLSWWNAQQPIEGGVLTTGTIVDFVIRTDSNNSETRFPVIEFTDRFERTHRFEPEVVTNGFGLEGKIGQTVQVRYDPADPTRAQWADQGGAWVAPATVAVGAVSWLAALGVVAWRSVRGRQARQGQLGPGAPTDAPG